MPARKKKEPAVQLPVEPEDSLGLPEGEPPAPAVPVTPEAYAAARAALAAQMVGPLYGQLIDPEPEPLVQVPDPAPIAPIAPTLPFVTTTAAAPVPLAQVSPTNMDSLPGAQTGEPPRHRRSLVIAAALLLLGTVALSTELIPIVTRSQPTTAIAGVEATPGESPSADVTVADPTVTTPDPTVTVDPTPTPTPTPTKKPTPKPTRRPTPRPTKKPTPKPTTTMYVSWISIKTANPPTFSVKTKATASCTITRALSDGTHSRTSGTFTANAAGVASLTWSGPTWTSGTTYRVTARCTLGGNSASVGNQLTIP